MRVNGEREIMHLAELTENVCTVYKTDTSLRQTPCVGPGRFLVILL